MALTVIASGHIDPLNNPTNNPQVDLSSASLPTNISLYGYAADSLDASAVWTWAWTLLQKPTGSTAALSSTTAQNPTLNGVDVWGDYRLMLVATNTNASPSRTSETDPLKAPTASFVAVEVLGAAQGLRKPAAGARNWHGAYYDLVDEIEGLGTGIGTHTIVSHSDVTVATGADLDVLTGGGYADDPDTTTPNPGARLHKHKGPDIDVATQIAAGVVYLSDAPVSAVAPVALSHDHMALTATINQSLGSSGWEEGVFPHTVTNPPTVFHVIWFVPVKAEIIQWGISMIDGGKLVTTKKYTFKLFRGAQANALAVPHTMTQVGATTGIYGTPAVNNYPLILSESGLSVMLIPGQYIAVQVVQADDNKTGKMLTMQVDLVRRL